jgi:hypothetical protein
MEIQLITPIPRSACAVAREFHRTGATSAKTILRNPRFGFPVSFFRSHSRSVEGFQPKDPVSESSM